MTKYKNIDSESYCGNGSLRSSAKNMKDFIEKVIGKYNIKSILDMGCGNWSWMNGVNLNEVVYYGIDFDKEVIDYDIKTYKTSDNINFIAGDFFEVDLPKVDLVIFRDVLIHMPNDKIISILKIVKNIGKFVMLCTTRGVDNKKRVINYTPSSYRNSSRFLNLEREPFFLKSIEEDVGDSSKRNIILVKVSEINV